MNHKKIQWKVLTRSLFDQQIKIGQEIVSLLYEINSKMGEEQKQIDFSSLTVQGGFLRVDFFLVWIFFFLGVGGSGGFIFGGVDD